MTLKQLYEKLPNHAKDEFWVLLDKASHARDGRHDLRLLSCINHVRDIADLIHRETGYEIGVLT